MRKRRKEKEEEEKENQHKANEMPQRVKALATKLDYLRLFRVHTAERRRTKFSRCLLTLCVHTHTHTVNQELWNKSGEDSGKTTEVSSGAVTVLKSQGQSGGVSEIPLTYTRFKQQSAHRLKWAYF